MLIVVKHSGDAIAYICNLPPVTDAEEALSRQRRAYEDSLRQAYADTAVYQGDGDARLGYEAMDAVVLFVARASKYLPMEIKTGIIAADSK